MPSPGVARQLIADYLLDTTPYGVNILKRWEYFDNFETRPQLVADMEAALSSAAATRLYNSGNKSLLLSGTNMTTALSTNATNGGTLLTTAGNSGDTANVAPLGWTTLGPALQAVTFDPAFAPMFQAIIETPATITTMRILAGFRLTAPATADETTDNDFALIAFNPATSASWRFITKVGGGSVVTVTGSNLPVLAASTRYKLEIRVDLNRNATAYISGGGANNVIIGPASSAALTSGAAFKPVISVQTLTAAARALTLHGLRVSRNLLAT